MPSPSELFSDLHHVVGPIGDRVLLKPLATDAEVGGMIIPQTQQEKSCLSTVVAAGPGRRTEFGALIHPQARAGDLVSHPPLAGQEMLNPPGFAPGLYLIAREDELWFNHGPAAAAPSPERSQEAHE